MLYLTCTMIFSSDLAHYRVSSAKDWVSVDCGTTLICGWFGLSDHFWLVNLRQIRYSLSLCLFLSLSVLPIISVFKL